jgi:uncharacterized membrane protein
MNNTNKNLKKNYNHVIIKIICEIWRENMNKKIIAIVLLILIISAQFMTLYAKDEFANIKAKVVKLDKIEDVAQDEEASTTERIQKVTIKILEGEYENEEYELDYTISENINNKNSKAQLKDNQVIFVTIESNDGEISNVKVIESSKQNYFIYMIVFSCLLILLIGKKKAIKPLILFSFLILYIFLYVISVKNNSNIIFMTFVFSTLINITITISMNGFSSKTISSMFSCLVGSFLSGIIIFTLYNVTGLNGNIMNVEIGNVSIGLKELIASGAILTSTGVCSISASVLTKELEGLKVLNPEIKVKELYKKGNEKGIEHVTKIFSFIILIYLCNSMLLVSYIQNYTINNENIFITILYLFSIFISSLLIIPIVSFTYVELNKYKIYYKTKSSNIIDGQRSLKL